MRFCGSLVDAFIEQVEGNMALVLACTVIKAYEAKNLPIPIKKTYLSFSGEENKVEYFTDENGKKMEKNNVTIRMSSFIPLGISPSSGQKLSELVAIYIANNNGHIDGFTVGETVYDSNVDAYRITTRIYFSEITEKTA